MAGWNSLYHATKVQTAITATCALAVAYTCLNMNAAESLVRDLIADVKLVSPRSLLELEEIIKNRMCEWSKAYTVQDDRPNVSLLIGSRINKRDCEMSEFGLTFANLQEQSCKRRSNELQRHRRKALE